MSGMWDDEQESFHEQPWLQNENGDFQEIAQQTQQTQQKRAQAPLQHTNIIEEVIQDLSEETENEDDYSATLSDANLRIEQGTLYKMIMNHDLFEGMDVDPRAVKNVQRSIRKFAKEQMELMLGMRQPENRSAVDSIFNETEIMVLKKLVSAATKNIPESQLPANVQQYEKKTGITPITAPKQVKKPQQQPQIRTQTQTQTQTQPPIKQPTPVAPIDRKAKPVEPKPLFNKDKVTEEDLIQRNAEIAARQALAKAKPQPGTLPMPSTEQQELLYAQRITEGSSITAQNAALLGALRRAGKV